MSTYEQEISYRILNVLKKRDADRLTRSRLVEKVCDQTYINNALDKLVCEGYVEHSSMQGKRGKCKERYKITPKGVNYYSAAGSIVKPTDTRGKLNAFLQDLQKTQNTLTDLYPDMLYLKQSKEEIVRLNADTIEWACGRIIEQANLIKLIAKEVGEWKIMAKTYRVFTQ